MSKAERKAIGRRGFLKLAGAGFAALELSKLSDTNEVLDLIPENPTRFAVWPLNGDPKKTYGDGRNPGLGYTHLMPTVDVNYQPDGGRHIGTDFNLGDYDTDCGASAKLIMDGVCVFAGDGIWRELGKIAIFAHRLPDETLVYSRYAHLGDWTAEVGRKYNAGAKIGNVGKSGREKGFCHLHLDLGTRAVFEEHYTGIFADPWWYPHKSPTWYQERYYLDPVKVIKDSLKKEGPFWEQKFLQLEKYLIY